MIHVYSNLLFEITGLVTEVKMSLRDIQLHLSRFFCWHAGLGYGTRSSPQMKTSNMNLTLLTTDSKATKRWGAEEGLIITPCASRIPANPPTHY